jgi:hypothetical protein
MRRDEGRGGEKRRSGLKLLLLEKQGGKCKKLKKFQKSIRVLSTMAGARTRAGIKAQVIFFLQNLENGVRSSFLLLYFFFRILFFTPKYVCLHGSVF